MTETTFAPVADNFALAPVIFSIPGGWLNVQRRCQPLTDDEWQWVQIEYDRILIDLSDRTWFAPTCDFKRENFGMLNGRIVLLDYGELT